MKLRILSLMALVALASFSSGCAPQNVSGASNDTEGEAVQDQAGLIEALEAAGANVEPGHPIEQPFISVPGQILKVNAEDVQVYEYETAEAMGTEASQITEDGGRMGTSTISWVDTPHFFRSGRLLVLYVGGDAAVLDLLNGALGEEFAGR